MRLAELARLAWRNNSVVVAYVYGNFGSGKTSYALWTAYEVLGGWERVLKYLFFDPGEAAAVMRRAIERGRRLPVIIMDDAGLWLDRMTWWEEEKVAFMQFFNLIRSVAACVIFTTPTEELPKQILRKSTVRVRVEPVAVEHALSLVGGEVVEAVQAAAKSYGLKHSPLALATGYVVHTLPSFMQIVSKQFYDLFPLHYPVVEEYERKRRAALRRYFERWESKVLGRRSIAEYRRKIEGLLAEGRSRAEVVKVLMKEGVPRATAYYWVRKLSSEQKQGAEPPPGE